MPELLKVSKTYLPAFAKALEEYKNDNSPYIISTVNSLVEAFDNNSQDEWVQNQQDEEKGINLKPGYVSSTTYWLMDEGEYIGTFALRHSLTEHLKKIGGHIAYTIRPSKRRQGYAIAGLSLCLKEAAKMGIEKAMVTCNVKNTASHAVMIKALHKYGGEVWPDIEVDGGFEHRVLINTGK